MTIGFLQYNFFWLIFVPRVYCCSSWRVCQTCISSRESVTALIKKTRFFYYPFLLFTIYFCCLDKLTINFSVFIWLIHFWFWLDKNQDSHTIWLEVLYRSANQDQFSQKIELTSFNTQTNPLFFEWEAVILVFPSIL